jgi:hypothetical protein
LASTPPTEEAFVREVDEELRQEQLLKIWKHYGRIIAIAVLVFLVAFAGYLFWRAETRKAHEAHGETMSAMIADVRANKPTDAGKKIDTLVADGGAGYKTVALMTKAAIAASKNDVKGAAAIYAGIAADTNAAKPFRDVALIRQTLIEFDTLPPQQVIDRMKPLAVEGGAFFGTAGELTAIALLQQNKTAEAGRLLATMARDKQVSDSLRARSARLATSLGVDVDATPAAVPAKD